MTRRHNTVAIAALLWLALIVTVIVAFYFVSFWTKMRWEIQVLTGYADFNYPPMILLVEPAFIYLTEAILTGSAFLVFVYILLRFTDFTRYESVDTFVPLPKKRRRRVELIVTKIRKGICRAVSPEEEKPKKREPPPIETLRD